MIRQDHTNAVVAAIGNIQIAHRIDSQPERFVKQSHQSGATIARESALGSSSRISGDGIVGRDPANMAFVIGTGEIQIA